MSAGLRLSLLRVLAVFGLMALAPTVVLSANPASPPARTRAGKHAHSQAQPNTVPIPVGIISTFAGDGNYGWSGDNGPATEAELQFPYGFAFDQAGNVYIVDAFWGVVRKVDRNGIITTIAGDGEDVGGAPWGDGATATKATLNGPIGMAFDPAGNLYISVADGEAVRKVDFSTGIMSTVVGTCAIYQPFYGNCYSANGGYMGDGGPATKAELDYPEGLAFDGSGNLYIADASNNAIRRVIAATGIIETFAGIAPEGTSGCAGQTDSLGDGCPATHAILNTPFGLAFDSEGSLYISDSGSRLVRRVDHSTGIMTRAAGGGSGCAEQTDSTGDGCSPLDAKFPGSTPGGYANEPTGIAFDDFGNLYISDSSVVHVVDPVTGIMVAAAGNGTTGYTSVNEPATSAGLQDAYGIGTDAEGSLYIADLGHYVARKVSYALVLATPGFSPAPGTYSETQSVTISEATSGARVFYTTDGSPPGENSPEYGGAIPVSDTTTIRAIAFATGYTESAAAAATYNIEQPAAKPVFTPGTGTYTSAQTVKILDSTPGASIFYTANAATPISQWAKYTAPVSLKATETLSAIATSSGYSQSVVASATYTIEPLAPTPVISPAEGTYGPGQMVTISDKAIAGLVIHYTLRGNTPTKNSNVYLAPIRLARTTKIEAIAVAPGYTDSIVASTTYTIEPPAPTPTFSPAAGTVASGQIVKIGDSATKGPVIYYTTNGDIPTTSSTKYTSAGIKVTATETIKAIAVATGNSQSGIATAKYTVN